eukprot:gb/GECH01013189.1/.p1 GENE.gb/GECH01013189.1/~~gb/GECH01013189.1/.p1  ORF type:complete len:378 (+),score=163.47 gb/GECH01013189.1/:1-1134(+)
MFQSSDTESRYQSILDRKKRLEEERKNRIFDVKTRTIGIDKDGIDKQIEEKNRIKNQEKEREKQLDELEREMEQHISWLEQERQNARQQKLKSIDEYRKNCQRPEQRREFDLNDPDAFKKELPARISDDDPRLGPSTVQKLEGEDLSMNERSVAQQRQLSRWLRQQNRERKNREMQEQQEDRLLDEKQQEMDRKAYEMEQAVQKRRRNNEKADAQFNQNQAKERRRQEEQRKQRETMDRLEDIQNQMESDLLCERFDTTVSASDPYRFKPDNFKRLRQDQYDDIRSIQEQQREELQLRREEEKERERIWNMKKENERRKGLAMERKQARQQREQQRRLVEEQQRQAEEQRRRKKQLDEMYKNEVNDDFFSKFQTTTR